MDTNSTKNLRILAVDDEDGISQSYKKILSGEQNSSASANEARELASKLFSDNSNSEQAPSDAPSFDVVLCRQGNEAVEAVKSAVDEHNPFAVVFLDVRMPPGPDGVQTAEDIRKIDPNIQIVIVTGYSDVSPTDIEQRVPPSDKFLYIQKPFHSHELMQFARSLTAKWMAEEQLVRANDELEAKVQQRTAELTVANDKLQREVDHRKQAEEQLAQAHQQLQNYDHMKNDFAVNVSHELRTPLTIFKNIISNIHDGVLGNINDRQRQSIKIADREIDRLARIISDFLDISEIEAGKVRLSCQNQAIGPLVKDVIEDFKPLADEKNIKLVSLLPDEELFINVDYDRIVQVLFNLIENAIKFVPDCGGNITVRVKDLDTEVGIDVEDNGPGIEGDDIGKVFNRFVQIEKQIGPGAHGTGLGLAICKELVEMQGGRICVENKPTGGANFCFALPKISADETLNDSKGANQVVAVNIDK